MFTKFSPLHGVEVIVSDLCTTSERKQFRFPRSKRRRIIKKWNRNQNNWRTKYVPGAYQMGRTFIVHPTIYEALKKASINQGT